MATDIVVSEDAYEIRVAIMEDGRCAELFHERKLSLIHISEPTRPY